MTLFHLQLLISFLVGGSFVAGLSLAAEKADAKIAGIILSIPSTVAISMAFISWTMGPEKIPNIVPPIPFTAGVVLLMVVVYLYSAQWLEQRNTPRWVAQVICLGLSLGLWAGLCLPLAIFDFTNIPLSIVGFIITAGFTHYALHRQKKLVFPKPIQYRPIEKLFRALFAGVVIVTAVYLANTLGPLWGGVFSYFPAVYTATLILLHHRYKPVFLFKVFKNSALGSVPTLSFALAAYYTFPQWGTLGGLLGAYVVSLGIAASLIHWQNRPT